MAAENKKLVQWATVTVIALIIVIVSWMYYSERHPSTNDAYVQANIVTIAPQVTGVVLSLPIEENQAVKKGQLLLQLDPRPFQLAVEQAQAQLGVAVEGRETAKSGVKSAEATLNNAGLQKKRADMLIKSNSITESAKDDADSAYMVAEASWNQAKQQVKSAEANMLAAEAALHQAELNLSYTTITAPADGKISNLSIRPGNVLVSGQPTFSLVESNRWWVDANFKETNLKRIRPCQKASVELDAYSGHTFPGVVQGVNAASGAVFALLPPQNATGNWIKVTQRVPVRIVLKEDPQFPLHAGITATVSIDVASYARDCHVR